MKWIILAFAGLLSACVPTVENVTRINSPSAIKYAREVVAYRLKDAGSAQWRQEAVFEATERLGDQARSGTVVCGQLNARNSFGGYTGFTTYYVGKAAGRDPVIFTDANAAYKCQQVGYKI